MPIGQLQPEPVHLQVPYEVAEEVHVNTNWLWVVHLRLRTQRGAGSAARVVHEFLKGFFVDDEEAYLVYHEIEFDLNSDADAEQHRREIARILSPLADITDARVMLFVSTQSHETTGVPFFGVDPAAQDTRNWFNVLIPDEVRPWLRKHDTAVFMLCRGALVLSDAAYTELKAYCENLRVTRLLAFPARPFQAAFSACFFMGYVQRFVLEGVSFNEVHLNDVLLQSPDLGPQNHVIVMSPREDTAGVTVEEYFWTSPMIRPHGKDIPLQCPNCYALECFNITYDPRSRITTTRCLEPDCTYTQTYEPPQDDTVKELPGIPGVEGNWSKRTFEL
ncbi:hypothetical protein OH77DRAFT_1519978 [Trametes cingulata]|nr:hypothetical protein OH77DRAFT_1519978 [Trametes cingulata]